MKNTSDVDFFAGQFTNKVFIQVFPKDKDPGKQVIRGSGCSGTGAALCRVKWGLAFFANVILPDDMVGREFMIEVTRYSNAPTTQMTQHSGMIRLSAVWNDMVGDAMT